MYRETRLETQGTMIDLIKLQADVAALKEQDVSNMSDDERRDYQLTIARMNKALVDAMAKTSQKEHSYDMDELKTYIDAILSECWECRTVSLGLWSKFDDAQKLRRFSSLITLCVKQSNFKEGFKKQFPALSVQHSAIENAKTLQELRKACRAMVGPLKLARDYEHYKTSYDALYGNTVLMSEYNELLEKLEATEELLAETRRVNAEIIGLFEPAVQLEGKELLDAIETFKTEHQCTDTEACKPFNVSRTTLHRLRKEFRCKDTTQ
jgi:hypothetical protein